MKAIIRRKEGPGRGWWGPPKGTHTAQNAPGGYGKADLDTVTKRIQAVVPSKHTYRGISSSQWRSVRDGEPLTSKGENMLFQAGKRGELQTTNSLMQALAHAGEGVLVAVPMSKTVSKRAFADIRKVKGDSLALADISMAFEAATGNVIYKRE